MPTVLVAFALEASTSMPRVLRSVTDATYPRLDSSAATKYSPEIPHRVAASFAFGFIEAPCSLSDEVGINCRRSLPTATVTHLQRHGNLRQRSATPGQISGLIAPSPGGFSQRRAVSLQGCTHCLEL